MCLCYLIVSIVFINSISFAFLYISVKNVKQIIFPFFQLNVDRSKLEGPSDLIVYFSLPDSHKGQQLTSYGGYLRYKIKYSSTVASQTIKGPDVIMVVG